MEVTGFAMGLVMRFWAGIGGADSVKVGFSSMWVHFFQMSIPMMKRVSAIPIVAAGDVNVQCASAGLIWSSSLKSLLASNSPLYFVLSP